MRHACISRVPVIFLMLLACSLLSSCDASPRHQTGCSFWQIVASPNPGNVGDGLSGVFALASDNIWVTGSFASTSTSTDNRTLVEHWNGKTWSVVSNPQPQGMDSKGTAALWSLAPLSPSDIWAAGFYELPGAVSMRYLVEHWDGRAWSIVPTPAPARKLDNLRHIVAISDHDVWALTYNGSLLHWNGKVWSLSTLPNADQNGYSISNLAALPNGQVWLVGEVHDPTGPGPRTLIARSVQSCS